MDDRQEEVLKFYEFKVKSKYRARGAWVLDTDKGLKLLKSCDGSPMRLTFENIIKNHLIACGYKNVDVTNRNIDGNLISITSSGDYYVVNDWFYGQECNLHSFHDVSEASKNLASLHCKLESIQLEEAELESTERFYDEFEMIETFEKHNRELKRVNSYIKEKNRKNEFEVCVLNSFSEFYEEGLLALNLLKNTNLNEMITKAKNQNTVIHGSYNYHNVLMLESGIATTNFEKAGIGLQMKDFYFFIRKTMEKNNWNINYGREMIESYHSVRSLKKQDIDLLYILLLYPEKYWKIINYYFNNKKSWISQRNLQKLVGVIDQNEEKKKFLQYLKST